MAYILLTFSVYVMHSKKKKKNEVLYRLRNGSSDCHEWSKGAAIVF